jgi:hypothetical protein
MNFMTKKNQPVDTETRLRLIKRNISNALYGSGNRNAKTRFSGSEDVAISLASRGLDTYLIPRVVDSVLTSLSFLLTEAFNVPNIKFVFIYSATYPLGVGDQVGRLRIDMLEKTWEYNLITTEATDNGNQNSIDELNDIFTDFIGDVYNIPVLANLNPADSTQGYIEYYAIEGVKTRQFFVDAIPELLTSTWTDISNLIG